MQISVNEGIALIHSQELLITDANSALDLAMSVSHETGCNCLVLPDTCFCTDFFKLSTGLLGEVLQKYINYHVKLAIVGDFSRFTSKPLHDFIYESNNGSNFFFLPTEEAAVKALKQVQESTKL